jgi:two-component system cell cycle sensor histidine kinase/response regulator CckA
MGPADPTRGRVGVDGSIDSDPPVIRYGLLLTAVLLPVAILLWAPTIAGVSWLALVGSLASSAVIAFAAWRSRLEGRLAVAIFALVMDFMGVTAAWLVPLGMAFAVLLPSVGVAAMAGMRHGRLWAALAAAAWVFGAASLFIAITIGPRARELDPPAPAVTMTVLLIVSAMGILLLARNSRRQNGAIDAAVEAAERSARSAAELARTRELLTAILAASPFSIVSVDNGGNVQFFNPAAERLYGWKADEVLGMPVSGAIGLAPDEYVQLRDRLFAGEVIQREPGRRTTHDGRTVDVRSVIAPLRDTDGNVAGAVSITEDVTERMRLEAELRQSQKMETLGQLSGAIAHDFNNLLQAIHGYAELARADASPGTELESNLDEIRTAADRAAALTRQLLSFSQPSAAGARTVDVNATITDSMPMIRRLVGPSISLTTDLDPGTGCVFVDPGQLVQVVLNLAVNARDAMPSGGSLAIESRCSEDDPGSIRVCVRDSGRGIPADAIDRIFDPFFTTKAPGKGTGLGLTIVRSIVEAAGGEVTVQSEAGDGTAFTIRLPNVPDLPSDSVEPDRPESRGTETVLLVEDEEAIRRLTERVLRESGYRVLTASNADDARRLWQEHAGEVDLLLSDVTMPGTSGPAFAAELEPRPRTLFVSGHLPNDPKVPLSDETTSFLQKPFSVGELLEAVRRSLGENGE